MNIWIINHHALTNQYAGGTRHFDLAKCLIQNGHQVTIFASSFHYNSYKELKDYSNGQYYLREKVDDINFVWLKCKTYTKNNIKRLLSYLSFSKNLSKVYKEIENKPDVIIGSSVHLFAVNTAYKISKKLSTPFIMEVRDLWPQTLIDMGTSKYHPIVLLFSYLEKKLYKKADAIITLLPFANKYIQSKKVNEKKIFWIPNGVSKIKLANKVKENFQKPFNITYVGSLGVVNNTEYLLEAAKILKNDKRIVFNIIGGGINKAELKKYCIQNDLKNVTFFDPVPKAQIDDYISNADAVYISFLDSPLYKYGYSPNKLYDYLASGTCLLFATDCDYNPVRDYNAGVCVPLNKADLLADKILDLCQSDLSFRAELFENARELLKKDHLIEGLALKLENICKNLIEQKKHN